ncbi:hypothetical protein Ocin01_10327 [Orchesella cincta]|uniref:Uncharacterized protein n=1 Tax=Orchesella cincta TaxID=48709 RepID=A0A1D2MTX7_ORCCI|nr:hypothetical protein Ocin01_10327 [Orchesella cincta]
MAGLSVANVIMLLLTFGETLHQQSGDPKRFFLGPYEIENSDGTVTTNNKIRVSTLHAIRSVELLLNLFNVTVCTLQIIHSVKKDCLWITSSFLSFAIILFFLSIGATSTIYYLGILSNEMLAYHITIFVVYFCFICIVIKAYSEAKKSEDYVQSRGADDANNFPTEGSQTSDNNVTMETRFT